MTVFIRFYLWDDESGPACMPTAAFDENTAPRFPQYAGKSVRLVRANSTKNGVRCTGLYLDFDDEGRVERQGEDFDPPEWELSDIQRLRIIEDLLPAGHADHKAIPPLKPKQDLASLTPKGSA